jgi:N-acetylneuraminic acid mutarotase
MLAKKGPGKIRVWILVVLIILIGLGAGCQLNRARPQARHGAKMVYDPVGKQVILFGGRGSGGVLGDLFGDLWALDLDQQRWTKMDVPSGPAPRLSPGLVYDPSHHQLILFGGYRNSGRINDTWLFDLENNEWQEVFPAESPVGRSDMGLAYDENNQIAVLFGGYCIDFERDKCHDTWIFDPALNEWMEMDPVSSPPVMYGHSLDYDSKENSFSLFGGHMSEFSESGMSSAGYNNSIWSYSYQENNWVEIPPDGYNGPRKRYWHQAAYLAQEAGLFVFGGDGGYGYLDDSWIFEEDTESWSRVNPDQSPPARIVGSLVYSPDYDQLILFGGLNDDFNNLNDTWIYTASTAAWEQISP